MPTGSTAKDEKKSDMVEKLKETKCPSSEILRQEAS
jgi:hypothetical protein